MPVRTWTPEISYLNDEDSAPMMRPASGGMWVSVSDYNALLCILVEAAIPIEALIMSGKATASPEILAAFSEAALKIRTTVGGVK